MKCPSPSILDPYYFEPSFTSAIIDATCRTPTNLIDSKKALQRTPLLLSFFLKSAYKPPSINLSQFFKAPAATSISNIKQSGQNPAGMMLDRLQTLQFPSELTSVLEDFAVDDFEVETYIFSCNTFIYGCKVPVDPLLQSYVEAFSKLFLFIFNFEIRVSSQKRFSGQFSFLVKKQRTNEILSTTSFFCL